MSNKDEASSSEELKQNQETNTVTLDEYEKIKDDYLRLAADFENFKKRNEKENNKKSTKEKRETRQITKGEKRELRNIRKK